MKVVTSCLFAALAVAVSPAPMEHEGHITKQQLDLLRDKRSQYGVQYVSPCAAAAASAPMPAFAPAYHYDMAPHGYVVPHYGYGGPHYRSVDPLEAEHELLAFSDMNHMEEHIPMARYGYATPSHGGPIMMPAPMPSPAAYGVFPNANSGGCNVPLLFSCSPSIVQGRMVNPQAHNAFAVPADSYRGVVDPHLEAHDGNEEATSHEHSASHEPSHISLHKQ